MTLTLRPYQVKAVDDVRAEYMHGRTAPVLVMPTGAGKTQVAAFIIRSALDRGNRTLFCAGRTELLDQTVDKLRGAGVSSIRLIQASRDIGPRDAEVVVASIQTLTTPKWMAQLPPAELLILDECFPAGTMVDGRAIETLRVGDAVRSYNEATDTVELRPIRRLFRSRPSALVTVHLDDGRAVTCTAGHPFFTRGGYVAALNLAPGDQLYGENQIGTDEAVRSMRNRIRSENRHSDADLFGELQTATSRSSTSVLEDVLRRMRTGNRADRSATNLSTEAWSGVLFDNVQGRAAVPREFRAYGTYEPRARQQAHDRAQSDDEGRRSHQDVGDSARSRASAHDPRRQWDWAVTNGAALVGRTAGGMGLQSGSANDAEFRQWLPGALQDRPGTSEQQNGRGDRRAEPWHANPPRAGFEKTGIARVARVVRVEIHERRGADGFEALCPDDLVYNIEVDGNHNYFANGVLVHNCHHGSATTWASVLNAYPAARRLGLTATPERADGKPLGDLFDCLVTGPSVRELMDLGHLVECVVFPPAGGAKLDTDEIALDPVAAYQRHGNGERAIVFCVSRKHAAQVEAEFLYAGIAVATIDGTMSRTARRDTLARFRAGEYRVLSSIGVLTEGWDDPGCSVAILVRGFGHPGLYIQCAGRILRPAPGKSVARLIDLVGSVWEHGTPDIERAYSLDGKAISQATRMPIRQCLECGAVFRPNQRCPNCGMEQPMMPFAPPTSTGIGLTEIKGPVAPKSKPEHVVSIVAKYPGRCTTCLGRIEPGERIWWATVAKRAKHNPCHGEARARSEVVHG